MLVLTAHVSERLIDDYLARSPHKVGEQPCCHLACVVHIKPSGSTLTDLAVNPRTPFSFDTGGDLL